MSEVKTILFGIDLGTTNTVISYFEDNKSKILTDGPFKVIPSKIYISPENKIYYGNYIPIGAKDIINSFKIEIGKDYKIIRNDKEYNIQDILNIFINQLRILIKKKFQEIIQIETVITVPSNFSDNQREIIRNAFINNNFNVIRIINEPSAAALSYGLNDSDKKKIMVIDTGGGTMDITILQKDGNFFEVVHSIGLNDLGGNNFTNIILNDIKNKINITDESIINDLFYTAQRMKEKLSYVDTYSINLKQFGIDYNYELSYTAFNKLSHKLLNRIDELLSEILEVNKDIEYFVLVGGSSKMKILQEKIYDITRKKPWCHPNLESVVAEGASLYAAIIKGIYDSEEEVLLVDVAPLSLGIETADGNFSVIIPKNTPLPAKRSQKYTTDSPGESQVKVKIYQGERKIANKNTLIGEFIFDKVSLSGMPIIEISFRMDLNGIINVVVLDKKSTNEKSILLKDIPKYNPEILAKILEEAELNNESDDEMVTKFQRIYIIKNKIENALSNLSINELLSEETKKEIQNELNELENDLDNKTNVELLEIIQKIDDKFSGLTNSSKFTDNEDTEDKKMDDLEKVLVNEVKSDVIRRANLLLVQNPDWSDFIKPLLEELEITNLSIDYLQDKLSILKELQEDDNDDEGSRDYKEELNNMCIYLKTELDQNQIDLSEDKKIVLTAIIIENLDEIEKNIPEINWEEKLKEFNKACESLYFVTSNTPTNDI
jgi:molecular chaperone DnaK